jgi:hypothetical protein
MRLSILTNLTAIGAKTVATLYEGVVPIYQLADIPEEFVTPRHSTAYSAISRNGRLRAKSDGCVRD